MGGDDQPSPEIQNTRSLQDIENRLGSTTAGTTSGTTTGTTAGTNMVQIPDWMRSGIQSAFDQYGGSLQDMQAAIGDWRNAAFNPDQLAGFQSARDAFGEGTPFQSSQDYLDRTIRGDFLYGGDAFNQAVEAAQRQAQPGVLSAFGMAGRGTGGLAQAAMARAYADPFAAQYGQERQLQDAVARYAPGAALLPSQTLRDIGLQQQQHEQYGINTPLSLYPQMFSALGGISSFANPFLGQATTGTQTGTTTGRTTSDMTGFNDTEGLTTGRTATEQSMYPSNPFAGILGGTLAGVQTGASIPGLGPWGAIGGGLLGGIAGAF